MIQFGHQMPDYDSSATQSTSGSHQEVSGMSEGSLNEHNDRSGNLDGYTKSDEDKMMSALSLGNPETGHAHPKSDRGQSYAISYPYADPFYGGAVSTYGSHAIMHPQIVGMVPSSRVPLPIEPAAEEPIYVNAKQYHAILRRRQLRAKLEAENKLVKNRKGNRVHASESMMPPVSNAKRSEFYTPMAPSGAVLPPICSQMPLTDSQACRRYRAAGGLVASPPTVPRCRWSHAGECLKEDEE
ncbi:hypothetical protein EJB05_07858 [Eragrostis curvula]|uniref:Nuclear transcription factor Y subunit n=1 Tax=Eragrostis curvula TaxID=38414 RepID=A0A5J9WIV6_9POAL|nr:hypothetical protein EJB05_07858 [Eragrostis curvula]